jgi:hypothetical protein
MVWKSRALIMKSSGRNNGAYRHHFLVCMNIEGANRFILNAVSHLTVLHSIITLNMNRHSKMSHTNCLPINKDSSRGTTACTYTYTRRNKTHSRDCKQGICPPFAAAIIIFLVLLVLQSLLKLFPMSLHLAAFLLAISPPPPGPQG